MGWIVTSWRSDALAALADAEARAAARGIVLGAEREARRLERGARRELADVRAYLDELERLGLETRQQIAERRRELHADRAEPPEPAAPIRVRRSRATLRDSPLGELFRATAPPG